MSASLDRWQGVFPGLPVIRLLAILVLLATQSLLVGNGAALLARRLIWAMSPLASCALFASVGLAMAAARTRKTARRFAIDTARRGVPAYAIAILASALILGPATTGNGVRSYFSDPASWLYLANLVAIPRFELPGVFAFNDLTGIVNIAVWGAPVYLALALVAGVAPRIKGRLRFAWLGSLVLAASTVGIGLAIADRAMSNPFTFSFLATRGVILGGFNSGVAAIAVFHARDKLQLDKRLVAAAAALIAAVALLGNPDWGRSALFYTVETPPLAYLVMYFSLRPLPARGVAVRLADFSAGAVLFSFPVQQLVVAYGPRGQSALVNLAIAAPLIAVLAALSWYIVQRRVLSADQRAVEASDDRRSINWRVPGRPLRRRVSGAMGLVGVGALFLAVILGAMAMLFLALQRDAGGV